MPNRARSGGPVGRTAPRGIRARAARTASPTSGTSSEIVPLSVIPQATAMIPSASARARISVRPARLPTAYPSAASRVVVERGEAARGEAGEEVQAAGGNDPAAATSAAVSWATPEPSPVSTLASQEAASSVTSTSGTAIAASASAKPTNSPASRSSSFARASAGRTAIRIACALIAMTMKTP